MSNSDQASMSEGQMAAAGSGMGAIPPRYDGEPAPAVDEDEGLAEGVMPDEPIGAAEDSDDETMAGEGAP